MRGGDSYCHFAPTGDGLFATTALVMTAGVAAAEVAVSGNGRMGVAYNGTDWNFSSRARVGFALSGTTDGGLEFGAGFRADNAAGAAAGTAGSIYISGAFGKIEMGDVVSAPENLFGDLPEVGYTDIANNDIPYLTLDNGNNNLAYTYSAGAVSVAASMSDGVGAGVADAYSVAAAYTSGNFTVGLGYESLASATVGAPDITQVELAAVATFGDTSVKAYFADQADGAVDSAYGVGVTSKFGATTVMAFAQTVAPVTGADVTSYGLGASYDLGGGASVVGGIGGNDVAGSNNTADLGIKFSF